MARTPRVFITDVKETSDPGATDDESKAFDVGSRWINTSVGKVWFCVDITVSAAVWKDVSTPGAGTHPVHVDTVDPTVNDDSSAGFIVGEHWINTVSADIFQAVSVGVGVAVWVEVSTKALGRTVILAKSGGDATTLAEAITSASALTPLVGDPVTILAHPGVYSTPPATLPAFVSLQGVGGAEVTEFAASTATSPLLIAPAGTRVTGCQFSGANGVGGVGVKFATGGERTRIDACLITDCTTGLLASGAGARVFADAVVILRRTGEVASEAFKAESGGSLFCFSCRANGEAGVLHTSGYSATGSGSVLTTNGGQAVFCTNGIKVELSATLTSTAMRYEGCTQSRRVGPGASGTMISAGSYGLGAVWDALVDGATSTLELGGDEVVQANLSFLTDTVLVGFTVDHETVGDEAFVSLSKLTVGRAELGRASVFGEGDSYVRGMVVITTDGTAGASADGGNLTDVSANAASGSGSTFTFQGVTSGHAIMFGSTLTDGAVLKHWGLRLEQTTAAVEVTAKSFVYEIWDGANWIEVGAMATHSTLFHRYGNEHFIRANTPEHVRYGIDDNTTWSTKLISGDTLFWSRIRIATTITTAPVFEQSKLSTSRFKAGIDGTNTYHGNARFRRTLVAAGNVFGESGGVTDFTSDVGSGGLPTGWGHVVKNSSLKGNGDAVYTQFPLPAGIDTSHPVFVDFIYEIQSTGAGDDAVLICSFKPIEVIGALVADPAGGVTPTRRVAANTNTLTAVAGEGDITSGLNIVTTVINKLFTVRFGPFTVEDYYEGDMVAIRLEFDDDGTANVDLRIWALAVTGVLWTAGEKL